MMFFLVALFDVCVGGLFGCALLLMAIHEHFITKPRRERRRIKRLANGVGSKRSV